MSPRRVRARENEMNALAMRKAGKTYAEIGSALGMTDICARKCVARVMARMGERLAEDVQEVRQMELMRLDRMHDALWPLAEKGNPVMIDRCLKIQERRAKLLGLDAATKMEHSGEVGIRQYQGVNVDEV